MSLKLLIIMPLIGITACGDIQNISCDTFIELEEKLDSDQLELIKNADIGELETAIKGDLNFTDNFEIPDESLEKCIGKVHNSIRTKNGKHLFILLSFRQWLKEENVNQDSIFNSIIEYNEQIAYSIHFADSKTSSELAEKNFSKFSTGDTINLMFPVIRRNERLMSLPVGGYTNIKGNLGEDSLSMNVLVLNKFQSYNENQNFEFDSISYFFQLKIIALSDSSIELYRHWKISGDTFYYDLNDYNKNILD